MQGNTNETRIENGVTKINEVSKKVIDEAKKKAELFTSQGQIPKADEDDFEEFNIISYIGGHRVEVGRGWWNSGTGDQPRIEIKTEIARYLTQTKRLGAWLFPRKSGKKGELT